MASWVRQSRSFSKWARRHERDLGLPKIFAQTSSKCLLRDSRHRSLPPERPSRGQWGRRKGSWYSTLILYLFFNRQLRGFRKLDCIHSDAGVTSCVGCQPLHWPPEGGDNQLRDNTQVLSTSAGAGTYSLGRRSDRSLAIPRYGFTSCRIEIMRNKCWRF